ncbi:hypothetical protein J132_03192 [Termitomyces sp. J132]|nr:hypothetical protein H2248_010198 [Termitomyces sp. 'cryptogamus']KNZ77916.1 hypothetical protein J132_03192 [Termitomyces sp. J132]
MSRRESRVSTGARQNDALFEFENFKKKFLLANKHITKLNSTLSVRIEELNAEISKLYVENLKLKASEIALAAQLKREREKSRKVMAEAEAATHNLTKHLGYLRQTFNIPIALPIPISPPSPRARKPPSTVNTDPGSSPQGNRLSRPPNIPGICEEDELSSLTSESELAKPPSPVLRKVKAKSRLSTSRLPVPSRISSPPPQSDDALQLVPDLMPASKPRKPLRRQSGLLSVDTETLSVPRAPSPAFGSPIRRAAGLAEEEEEMAAVTGQLVDLEDLGEEPKPSPKKERRKSRGKGRETLEEPETVVESSKPRERKKKEKLDGETDGGGKTRLQDVTNSRAALLSIDNTVPSSAATRAFLTTSPTPSVPTSRGSSSPVPPGEGEALTGGRERRQRKSVNYAEPKLNTKMRKPDSATGTAFQKKRSSVEAILTTYRPPEDTGIDADNDTEARSSLELPLRSNGTTIHPESLPLPPSRPTSSISMITSPSPPRSSVKRKKSRPILENDDSDGAEADAEYGVPGNPLWVNVDGRRRAVGSSGMSSGASTSSKRVIVALEDPRRHSMTV